MKQNLLLITSEFPPGPGGIGHHAWFLAKYLSENPFVELHVISPGDYTTKLECVGFDSSQSFKVFRFQRKGKLTYILRIITLLKLIKKYKYTHFWASGKFSLWMIWVQKLFLPNSKSLCILHGSEINLTNPILRKFTHNSIYNFQTIVSVSEFTKSLLPNWILNTHDCLVVIPNGLDYSDLAPTGCVKLEGSPALLTVGHVTPRKGQHRMIHALPELLKSFPKAIYHIVGRPINQKILEEQALTLGVYESVVFHGSIQGRNELWNYYEAADVFVLLSENQTNGDVEGFGIVALEANAMGIPVIGAKYCGVAEAVNDRISGVLVDGNNIEEIVEGIQFCVENRFTMKLSCEDWAKMHDWNFVGKRFLDLV